jgi:hypothetical protein
MLDRQAQFSSTEYPAFLASPLFHVREFLSPAWISNWFVIPVLVSVAVTLTVVGSGTTAAKQEQNKGPDWARPDLTDPKSSG